MSSETRWFAGLNGSQYIPSGTVSLNYEYNLAGELKKITNPWNVQVSYNPDKIGRVTSVNGANYAGVTSYISNISYRAFGAAKEVSYNNGKTLSLSYNNRLLLSAWNIPGVLSYSYSYNYFGENTGRVTFASNLTNGAGRDATLDRSYSYDHVGRLNAAYTGTSALAHTGQGSTWGGEGPYAHVFQHDVWGNITQRQGWGGTNAAYSATFNGNRMATNPGTGQPFIYDGAGNVTSEGTQTFTYDARGQQVTASSNGLQQGYGADALRLTKVEDGGDHLLPQV